ncbi:MAG: hypothetical protein AAGH64_00255 [Planctomycetota bacterium]
MNVRLLIIFGIVLQLFAVHTTSRCASHPDDAQPIVFELTDSDCSGCCGHQTHDSDPDPQPERPCEACPICTEITSEPNRLAVLQTPETVRPPEQPTVERWSLINEYDADTLARASERITEPPPMNSRVSPPVLCRWLT